MEIKRTKFPIKIPTVFIPEKKPIKKVKKIQKTESKNELMNYWNDLPNVHKHLRPESGVYKLSEKFLKELMTVGFTERPWDRSFLHKVKLQFLRGPWSEISIRKSMSIISQMNSPGYWPGPDSFLCKYNLPEIIYNSRTQKSWLLYARSMATPPQDRDKQMDLFLKRNALESVHEIFVLYNITVSISFLKVFQKEYEELGGTDNIILFNAGGMVALAERYASWLNSRNISEVSWLKGKLWDNFKKDTGLSDEQY